MMFDYRDVTHFDSADLDRHITGNYGEDQLVLPSECELCETPFTAEDPAYDMYNPKAAVPFSSITYCHFDCGIEQGLEVLEDE
jgi:hypothetical protein